MAIERGLPSVPRGLSRDLTSYLQALHNIILSISGLGRGTESTRAMRVYERVYYGSGNSSASASEAGAGSVTSWHLANGAVTEVKIADGAVTHAKLAASAVQSVNIKPEAVDAAAIKSSAVTTVKLAQGAVTYEKIADNAVSMNKLAPELMPRISAGKAAHGETVNIGHWLLQPFISVTGMRIPVNACGELQCGIGNLRQADGEWLFDAVAVCEMGEADGESFYPGELDWIACGWRDNVDA